MNKSSTSVLSLRLKYYEELMLVILGGGEKVKTLDHTIII